MGFMRSIAEGCMPFLYFLESIRGPVLDAFFALITHLGEETLFLVIAIVFFWCVNKREWYYILLTGLYGTLLNQTLKLAFRIERPYVRDPNFKFVGNANVEATGYSFYNVNVFAWQIHSGPATQSCWGWNDADRTYCFNILIIKDTQDIINNICD